MLSLDRQRSSLKAFCFFYMLSKPILFFECVKQTKVFCLQTLSKACCPRCRGCRIWSALHRAHRSGAARRYPPADPERDQEQHLPNALVIRRDHRCLGRNPSMVYLCGRHVIIYKKLSGRVIQQWIEHLIALHIIAQTGCCRAANYQAG